MPLHRRPITEVPRHKQKAISRMEGCAGGKRYQRMFPLGKGVKPWPAGVGQTHMLCPEMGHSREKASYRSFDAFDPRLS